MMYWQQLLTDFHFLRPLWLLFIIPACLLVLVMTMLQGKSSQWARNIDPSLLPYLLDRHHTPKQNLPVFGLLFIWILSSLALAGPTWQQLPVPVQEKDDALIVVLDLSMSMYATDLTPDRITRSKRKLSDVLNFRKTEGQTALVVYAGDAHSVTPITDDVETINNLVPSLDPNIMPLLGSKPDQGIELAIELLENAGIEQARILFMTDGINPSDIDPIRTLIMDSGHSLSILGIGTEEGSPIPTAEGGFLRGQNNAIIIPRLQRHLLQQLAGETNGRYSDIQLNDGDIDYLLNENLFEENENLQESDREYDTWLEAGPWLVLLLLPFAAFAFRQGWVLCLPLLLILAPADKAMAFEWNDLWANSNQQASRDFEQEQFDAAAETFRDPSWRAASNYRRGRFEDVVAELDEKDDANSHYNRGNALAQLYRLEEAIAAYDRTLELEPDHADAQHNRQIVENLLEKQQQEQSQEQNESQQQQDQQQEQQDQEQSESQEDDQQQQSDQQNQEQEGEPEDQEGDQDQEEQQNEDQEQQESQDQEAQQQEMQQRELSEEEEQSIQQWLGRIQDDPGELLRNKFRQQSQQQLFEQRTNPAQANQRAQEQIW